MHSKCLILILLLFSIEAHADNSTLDAAIGGGIGGATGAAIGNELGGRDGAMIGGSLGAALGAAINTNSVKHHAAPYRARGYKKSYLKHKKRNRGYHCPPGQAKKGRC